MADILLGQIAHTESFEPLSTTDQGDGTYAQDVQQVGSIDAELQGDLADSLATIEKQQETITELSRLAPSSPPSDFTEAPGGKVLLAGDSEAGFYGFLQPSEFGEIEDNPEGSKTFNGDNLALALGISQGTSQYSDISWMKFSWNGKILFVPVKTLRYSISWNTIYEAGAVYGDDSVGTLPPNGRAGLELAIISDGVTGTDFTDEASAIIATSGETLTIAGSASNDGTYDVTGVTNTKITLDATLTPESSGNNDLRIWNPLDEVTQDAIETIGGLQYRIRLMRGAANDPVDSYVDSDRGSRGDENEWNRLILPLHERAKDDSWNYTEYAPESVDDWTVGLTDENMMTLHDYGSGSRSWCQEVRNDSDTYRRVDRGGYGVSSLSAPYSWSTVSNLGWRPVLELA